jgi:hypothetical protein
MRRDTKRIVSAMYISRTLIYTELVGLHLHSINVSRSKFQTSWAKRAPKIRDFRGCLQQTIPDLQSFLPFPFSNRGIRGRNDIDKDGQALGQPSYMSLAIVREVIYTMMNGKFIHRGFRAIAKC